MKYLSVCSGIEAATVAWHPLGWTPFAFAEIEKFPAAVLKHRYPHVPNLGDMTKFMEWPDAAVDVLVGGTPCQSFSVAGLRKGLSDPRGNLCLTFLAIADRYRPQWLVFENVPGVLSSNGGRDFGAFLGGLAELGYGFAYRVLDAQYVRVDGFPRAVPQRRRRVFVVGNSRSWTRAAAVLFERESLCGDPAPRRQAWKGTAIATGSRPVGGGEPIASTGDVAHCLNAGAMGRQDYETETMVAYGLRSDAGREGTAKTPSPDAEGRVRLRDPGFNVYEEFAPTVDAGQPHAVAIGWAVRRLTPVEAERLQGFPDNYTNIPWRGKSAPDGPRYKSLGNSFAVNCMRWIGHRIQMISEMA